MLASFLRWSDVAPSTRPPFDRPAVAGVVHPIVVAAGRQGDREALESSIDREALESSIDRALIAEYGPWAAGWRWSPGGGGPVNAWCCPSHSLLRDDDTDERDSTERVVAALMDWNDFLTELERVYADLPDGVDRWLVHDIEVAAARLLPLVVERTHAEDAWYSTLAKVLTWYAESRGHDASVVEPAIGEVIGGHFASWTAPSEEAATTAWRELRPRIEAALANAVTSDATSTWWKARPQAFRSLQPKEQHEAVRGDAHLRFINGRERRRDPARADKMLVALDACRASAASGEPLSFELLAEWQAIVLGAPVSFRSTDAFAKQGRERYAMTPKTQRRFEACLLEANDEATPVIVRAARVYLDVSFFHPFDDGNARSARLALDHVLSRAGLGLHAVEPLFVVARSASDSHGPWYLGYLLDYLAGPAMEEA